MLELEVSDQIAVITMRRPPVNALSRPWAKRFASLLDDLEPRSDWRVLRIRSGLKVFSAGGDIKEFASRLEEDNAGDLLADEAEVYQLLFNRIEALPQISIAEIQGVAAGGGFELALACDLRIASESARVGLPEVGVGLLPSAGGTQRMTRLCGRGRAMRFIATAELVRAPDALAAGLIEWVFPDEAFGEAADAIARRLATQPREALQAAKSCIAATADPSRDGFAEEIEAPRRLMGTAETRARINDFVAKFPRKANNIA
jgi:enoyl-CoA hydratase